MNCPAADTASARMTPSAPAPSTPCRLVQRLQGGLGNQLFQVLAARRLARSFGASLAFDVTSYTLDGYGRASALQRIAPGAATCAIAELDRQSTRLLRESDLPLPAQGELSARIAVPQGVSDLVLDGYWQDRRLIDPQDVVELLAHLQATVAANPTVSAWAQRIRNASRPTAVHVRRHDYKHHGLCAERYYTDALAWLAARQGALDVFVFSDEPNYTSHVLNAAGLRHHVVRSGDDLGDLYLMSLCHRHVISNSSYSWWAATLSGSDDVIYPDPWSYVHTASAHLCPPQWRKVAGSVERTVSTASFTEALDLEQLRVDRDRFFSQGALPPGWQVQYRPCIGDATATTGFDAHYVYHTSWAARRLLQHPVQEHVDIGSDVRFATMASAFQPIRFLDYRPAWIQLSGLACGHANLLGLQMPDASIPSLSCMHVVEHIGLGRYGDPIDFHGAARAMGELERVLAPGGLLYFVVPVGEPAVVFNAHRVFRASDVVQAFPSLELVEFSLVRDDGRFEENVSPQAADGQRYACGCFLLRKPA
jgi:hypothetical protein